MFWNRIKSTDERIINTQNKIYKEAYILVSIICFISIAVKIYLYGFNIRSVVSELLIIIIPSCFFYIRMVLLGLYSDTVEIHDRTSKIPMSIINVVISLSFGVIIALFFGIRSSILYAHTNSQRVFYFIVVFFVSLMIYCPLFTIIVALPNFIANRASKRVNSKNQD